MEGFVSSGNVTDEMWFDYIKNQTPPEPQLQRRLSWGAMSAEGGPIRL
jgi:hypothetical protein